MADTTTPLREVARYQYPREDGSLAYSVVRFEPKTFRPVMPDGTWGLTCDRILYGLPRLAEHHLDNFVWVCEGEKDADLLNLHGLVATTAGASRAFRATDTSILRKAWGLVVPADCDEAGAELAKTVALTMYPRPVHILDLGGTDGYDVSDYVEEHGVDSLMALRSRSPVWRPERTVRATPRLRYSRKRRPGRITGITPGLPHNIFDLIYELGGSRLRNESVVYCPAHPDEGSTPGLSLTYVDDEHTLAYCHSGCAFVEILAAVNERMQAR